MSRAQLGMFINQAFKKHFLVYVYSAALPQRTSLLFSSQMISTHNAEVPSV